MRYKLRTGANQPTGQPIKVLTCPTEIASFFDGVEFSIEKSGTCIVYSSGGDTPITNEELMEYNYEDCIVGVKK